MGAVDLFGTNRGFAFGCRLLASHLFAGVIFTESLRHCARKSSAFGANIVGAVAGGLAQNVSFILGMKALLLIAAFFYALAALAGLLSAHQTTLTQADQSSVSPL